MRQSPDTQRKKGAPIVRILATTLAIAACAGAGYAWQRSETFKQTITSQTTATGAIKTESTSATQSPSQDGSSPPATDRDGTQKISSQPAAPKRVPGSILMRARSAALAVKAEPGAQAPEQQTAKESEATELYSLGVQHLESGDPGTAIAEFSDALANLPAEAESQSLWSVSRSSLNQSQLEGLLYQYRASARLARNDPNACIEDLTKAIERSPQTAENYAIRGKVYQQVGLVDAAVVDYRKARLLQRGY